jgi:hypothetical protein
MSQFLCRQFRWIGNLHVNIWWRGEDMYCSSFCISKVTVACQIFCSKKEQNSSSFSWKCVQCSIADWKGREGKHTRHDLMTKPTIQHTNLKNTAIFANLILLFSQKVNENYYHPYATKQTLITIKSVHRGHSGVVHLITTAESLASLHRIREIPGTNLSPKTDYTDWYFQVFPQLLQANVGIVL